MTYLLLTIINSAIIPNVFHFGEKYKVNQPVVLTTNYFLASIIALISLFYFGNYKDIINIGTVYTVDKSIYLATIFGIVTGILYYVGFFYYQKSVLISGPSIASAFGRIGIVIPMMLSIIIWQEIPNIVQWFGIFLALGAIVVMAVNLKSIKLNDIHSVLIYFFLFSGLGNFLNKVFEKYCMIKHSQIFLFVLFLVALIVSLKQTVKIKNKKKWDFIIGIMVGIPNMLTSYFLIQSLNQVDAVIVFPIFSGGTIICASLISAIVFKERLKIKEYVGIGMMIAAVMLINYF